MNDVFNSIVEEEEAESLFDIDDEQEIINNHKKVLDAGDVSDADYFNKLFQRIVQKRDEERQKAKVKCASDSNWEVYFKVPTDKDQNGQMRKFFLKIIDCDVICVHKIDDTIESPKIKFLHSLVGCQFLIIGPDQSNNPGGDGSGAGNINGQGDQSEMLAK